MHFQNARLVLPDHILPGALRIFDGRSSALGSIVATPNEEVFDLHGRCLAPGFIDLHIHGAMRRDTMEANSEAFDIITQHHARGGTTCLALTTVDATSEDIVRVLVAVETYRKRAPIGARVLGVH